ncbi:MAG TPA: DJ-1/PfpI family protein [Xanthomonadaceae bacterium]|jgi:transcriptional regulator GlxA family with amidase domain
MKPNETVSRRVFLGMGVALGAAGMDLALGGAFKRGGAHARESVAAPLARLQPPDGPIRAAILLDQGATVIDFAGPWEALQDAATDQGAGFELYTVAARPDPVTASGGLRIVPDYTFANAPQPKVLVMGAQAGGRQASDTTSAKVEWIRHVAAGADIVMSVCTGAFLLARTGLLDGLSATTHHGFYDAFEQEFPQAHLVRNRRFVDNGKFLCGGGLTSGVDAALHVVARYFGSEAARASAAYMEHDSDGWLSGVRA